MRLIDDIYAQIPPRIRGRVDIGIIADPYYLRTVVTVTGLDKTPYICPVEVVLEHGKYLSCEIPDWFIAHICSIPVDEGRLTGKLWDSLQFDN